MEQFLQAAALVLLAVILSLVLSRQSRDMGTLLSLAVCCMVCVTAVSFLSPVVEFLREVRRAGELDSEFLSILLKCAGIGVLAELAQLICVDAREGAMGKALQILSNAAILWLSLPMMRKLLAILQEVLGTL